VQYRLNIYVVSTFYVTASISLRFSLRQSVHFRHKLVTTGDCMTILTKYEMNRHVHNDIVDTGNILLLEEKLI